MTDCSPQNDWIRFFAAVANTYDQEVFTQNTAAEVEFLCEAMNLRPGHRILDIGCGTGRHAIALAQKGMEVTGLDLSPHMLAQARGKAEQAGAVIRFIETDAAAWEPDMTFDAAISLCEGAFCLLGQNDSPFTRDMAILFMMAKALKIDAPFTLTVLNGYRFLRKASQTDIDAGRIDLFAMTGVAKAVSGSGPIAGEFNLRERYYTGPELVRMIKHSQLTVDQFWGGTAGNWRRAIPDPDEMELMVVGHRKK